MTDGNGGDGANGAGTRERQALKRAEAWEREMMAKHGWYAHFVTGEDPQSPTGFNAHTHGLERTFGHPDVQIVVPLPPDLAHGVMVSIVDLLKKGVRLEPGRRYEEVLQGYHVEFAWADESGRRVLRAILPDKDDRTAKGEIGEPYSEQWKGAE